MKLTVGGVDLQEVTEYLAEVGDRLRQISDRSWGVDAYVALNFVGSPIFVKIGVDKDEDRIKALRLEIPAALFDWDEIKDRIDAWVEEYERMRPPTHEELGRTLGILPGPSQAAAAE